MDLYEELGLGPDATADEIKAAHRRAVKKTHPDAGGDRQAFDRAQHAFNILSDQSKRTRYDETGVDSESPEQLARSQAMTTVAAKINAFLGDPKVDPRSFDLVLGVQELISADIREGANRKAEALHMIARLEQFKRRLKLKKAAKGGDRIGPILEAQIAAHRGLIGMLVDSEIALKLAKDLVAEYVYQTDPAQQAQGARAGSWQTWNAG